MDKVTLNYIKPKFCRFCRFGNGSFAELIFLPEIWTALGTLLFSGPEVKDPIIFDSSKKETQY